MSVLAMSPLPTHDLLPGPGPGRGAFGPRAAIPRWDPEDADFWAREGQAVARRNLWLSVPALMLSFAVWMLWSVMVVHLPAAGFRYSTNQLFWLAALPAVCGATLRLFYAFLMPLVGGRRWTALSTASLLLPTVGIGLAVQHPDTPFEVMVGLALLCGLGGGNFASSMAHISHFYPAARKGYALGLNAGLGNLGVAFVQLATPVVITVSLLGPLGGAPQAGGSAPIWLQNAAFVWVPLIAASSLAAWFGMNDLGQARAGFGEQAVIFSRPHTWWLSWLYAGSFGSFVGYAAALPLLVQGQFPGFDPLHFAWLGPLLGALTRPLGGWLADRLGGARVTTAAFAIMAAASLAAVAGLPGEGPGRHGGSLAVFLVAAGGLFAAAGIGNGSLYRMIPIVFLTHRERSAGPTPAARDQARVEGNREAAAALGFTAALGTYGGFFIPKALGTSIALTGAPQAALVLFSLFYLSCIFVTWRQCGRRGAPMPC